jgi:epoxyqueuosine reductase
MNLSQKTALIKQIATRLGFSHCGIAKAQFLEQDAKRLEHWLNQNYHGQMAYMANYFDQRTNPSVLVPGAKSVITLLKNYYPAQQQKHNTAKIAKYAYGADYHTVIRQQLKQFLHELNSNIGQITGRGFVDSAPVLERTWAQKSGLGWIGKNGNLIHPKAGSFFFIATLIIDVDLEYSLPLAKDFCGTCTACVDACPTLAILPNKTINAQQCISYYTIELKDLLAKNVPSKQFNNWVFGCDICQDVCPWNRFSKPHTEPQFEPIQQILDFNIKDWTALTEDAFKTIFKNSPLKRTKFNGLQRNINWLLQAT